MDLSCAEVIAFVDVSCVEVVSLPFEQGIEMADSTYFGRKLSEFLCKKFMVKKSYVKAWF